MEEKGNSASGRKKGLLLFVEGSAEATEKKERKS